MDEDRPRIFNIGCPPPVPAYSNWALNLLAAADDGGDDFRLLRVFFDFLPVETATSNPEAEPF
jgi:hypothetical protein